MGAKKHCVDSVFWLTLMIQHQGGKPGTNFIIFQCLQDLILQYLFNFSVSKFKSSCIHRTQSSLFPLRTCWGSVAEQQVSDHRVRVTPTELREERPRAAAPLVQACERGKRLYKLLICERGSLCRFNTMRSQHVYDHTNMCKSQCSVVIKGDF